MGMTTFQGPVRSLNGFIMTGPGSIANLANGTNTITLDVETYAGRIITTNDATLVITLPAVNASADPASAGPGSDPNNPNNLGAVFEFVVTTAATALVIQTNGTDKFAGYATISIDDSAAGKTFIPATSNDVMTMNGTTKGGLVGSVIRVTAIAANLYLVEAQLLGSSTLVTPFSDS